jgi:hypothetical protein
MAIIRQLRLRDRLENRSVLQRLLVLLERNDDFRPGVSFFCVSEGIGGFIQRIASFDLRVSFPALISPQRVVRSSRFIFAMKNVNSRSRSTPSMMLFTCHQTMSVKRLTRTYRSTHGERSVVATMKFDDQRIRRGNNYQRSLCRIDQFSPWRLPHHHQAMKTKN